MADLATEFVGAFARTDGETGNSVGDSGITDGDAGNAFGDWYVEGDPVYADGEAESEMDE